VLQCLQLKPRPSVVQCVAVCCSVWCSVYCSVLQCVAVIFSALQTEPRPRECCSVWQCFAMLYNSSLAPVCHTLSQRVLQCVAVCVAVCRGALQTCSTLQLEPRPSVLQCVAACVAACVAVCVAVCCSALQCTTTRTSLECVVNVLQCVLQYGALNCISLQLESHPNVL